MHLSNLRDLLGRFLNGSERKNNPSNLTPELSEKSRLIHRLNCIDLNEDEAKCLQGHLTTILEARHQDKDSSLVRTSQSSCLVLEMANEDFQDFVHHVGENGVHLFRAIVQSDNSKTPTQTRKLTIVGQHGLRLFPIIVRRRNSLLQN
ncbi:MAG TPA: hypothetical protein V6D14_29930 [Coleofasciculaceae cyanobacterium]